jgi:hypothetical protein
LPRRAGHCTRSVLRSESICGDLRPLRVGGRAIDLDGDGRTGVNFSAECAFLLQ